MAEDWIDPAISALTNLPGLGGLGLAVLAFFRIGRVAGRTEEQIGQQDKEIEALKARVSRTESTLADVPKRDEVRAMFAELRADNGARFDALSADIRAIPRG